MAGKAGKKGVAKSTVKPAGTKGSAARAVVAPAVNKQPKTKKRVTNSVGKTVPLKKLGLDKLVHELQMRQSELETQNEDLHRTQEQLQASQTRYFDLYDIAPVGYFSVSEKGIILEANITGANLLGAVPSDMRTQRFFNFIYEEDQDLYQQHRNKLFETRLPQECEMRMVRKDGTLIWVLVQAIVAKDAKSGKPVCLASMSDVTRQKKAEEALRHERDRTQGYLDTVETIIVSLNTEGRITAINRKGCQLFGYREDKLLGQLWFSTCLPQPDGMENVYPYFLKLIAGELEAAEYFENPIITRSGELRQIAWHNALLRDEKGRIIGTLSSGDDITERKKAEEALRASEERYHTVADFTYDWEYWMSPEGSYIYVSPSCKLHTGYEPEAFLQDPDLMLKIIHPDDRDILVSHRKESFDSHKISNTLDFRIITLNGEEHWISHRCQKVYSRDGKFLGVRGSNRDITKRKLSERALAESETRYRELFENASLAIFKSTLEGRALTVNPEFARMFGYESPEEVIATVKDIATDLFADPHRRGEIARLKKDNPDLNTFEVLYRRKDSSTFWGKLTIRMIADSDGAWFFEGFIDDITEHKQAEEALRKSEAQYRLLADHMTDTVWLMDMHLKTTYQSSSVQRVRGFTPQEIEEMPLEKHLTPESLKIATDVFLEEMAKIEADQDYNFSRTLELEFYRKDGTTFWSENTFSLIRDENGRPLSILGEGRDITERKLAEEKIRILAEESQWLLKSMINAFVIFQSVFDKSGKFISYRFEYINEAYEKITSVKLKDVRGKTVHEVWPETEPSWIENYGAVAVSGVPRTFDMYHKPTNKSYHCTVYRPWPTPQRFCVVFEDITERLQAEDSLRQSELRYRTVLEQMEEAYYEVDFAGNLTFFNDATCHQLGYSIEELMGMNYRVYTSKDDIQRVHDIYNRVYRTGNPTTGFPVCRIRKDGTLLFTENSAFPLQNKDGKTIGFRGVAHDISKRLQIENELRKSEAQYRLLSEHTTDTVWLMDMDLNFIYNSPSVEKLRGFTAQEVTEMPWQQHVTPESLKLATEVISREIPRVLADPDYNPTLALELEYTCKNGTTVWAESKFSIIRDENGKPVSILGEARDITDRRKTDELLRQSEAQYRLLSEHMTDTIRLMDMNLKTTYLSPSAEKLRGFTYQEVLELPLEKQLTPESLKVAFAIFSDEISRVKADPDYNPVHTLDLEYICKDGTTIWAESKFSVIRDKNGKPAAILAEARDITERRLTEEKLLKSYESLKKTLNDAINTMVKIVEIRDPYTAGHQQKVADLATAIAREMKLEDTRIDQIRTAAVIHDIGKINVPSDILSKPGKLSDIEFGLIKTHAQGGYDIVKGMDFPCNVAKAVLQHHERLDGSGYPNNLKGEDMLLETKILAVADVIEAMTSHRPYRAALGIDKALEEISKNKGKLYDPDVVDACLELFNSGQFQFKSA